MAYQYKREPLTQDEATRLAQGLRPGIRHAANNCVAPSRRLFLGVLVI